MGSEALERLVDDAARGGADGARLDDLYRGTLLGVAAGNALGLPVEGQSRSAIRRRWPGGIREIDAAESSRPWDDDVAQTAVVAEALLADGELDPEALAAHLLRWSRENGRGMGTLMGDVMSKLDAGASADEAARAAWERAGDSGAGNGAVMRCSPVALRWRTSGSHLVRTARRSALVTHFDARCEWSTVALDVALAVTLSGGTVAIDDLVRALRSVGGPHRTEEAAESAAQGALGAEGSLEQLELDDPMDMGYTIKAMQVGLWCLTQPPDFESVVAEVINAGGDTDTNGAVAGAVMGARVGARAIPARWLDNIAGVDRITELADGLLEASHS